MDIFAQNQGERLTLTLNGRLDAIMADLLLQKFNRVKDSTKNLSLDLSGLTYVSSAGLRAILFIMKTMKAENGSFSIEKISEEIRDVFRVTGFMELFVAEEEYVILIKEKNGPRVSLTVAGFLDLRAGMDLNTQIQHLEEAGFTEFVLDMSEVRSKTSEFLSVLREIQKRVTQKGKLSPHFS